MAEMQFHQYSPLFTSGLLPPKTAPPQPRTPSIFLNTPDQETPRPVDTRPCSFLELADPTTSPPSPSDSSSPWRSLGHCAVSVPLSPTAIRAPGPVPQRGTILASTPLKTAVSPLTTDSLPRLSIIDISRPIGHSFLITDPSLPDSPTLARGPSLRTLTSRSTSSASLSVKSDIKRVNRSAALACLEGRERAIPRKIQLNFMSMSDDEDEDDSFTPLCYPSTDRVVDQRLSAIPLPSSGEKEVETFSSDLYVAPSSQQSRMAPVKSRDRSRAIESWFPPLANFIDLRNEEDTPKWRSFIELSTATA